MVPPTCQFICSVQKSSTFWTWKYNNSKWGMIWTFEQIIMTCVRSVNVSILTFWHLSLSIYIPFHPVCLVCVPLPFSLPVSCCSLCVSCVLLVHKILWEKWKAEDVIRWLDIIMIQLIVTVIYANTIQQTHWRCKYAIVSTAYTIQMIKCSFKY